MADVIKVLGQSNPAATTNTDLYEVPNNTVTTVSTLVVCNRAATSPTFRVAIRPVGADLSNEHYIYYGKVMAANDSIFITIGMTLSAGDIITVYVSAQNISFTLFGVETS